MSGRLDAWRARWMHLRLMLSHRPARLRWAEDLDFLGRKQPAAWWAWGLLVLGALALILLGLARQDLGDAQDRADARLRQAQRFAHQVEMRSKMAAADAARGQAQAQLKIAVNEQTLRAATRLVRQLSYPWAEVLDGVEAASGDVALLGLRHDTQSGEVHLDAAVRDDLMALHWVDALSADHAHFDQAYLQSREPLQQPVGEFTTRVQLVAVLNPRLQAAAPPVAQPVASAASAAASAAAASASAVTTTTTTTITAAVMPPTLPPTRVAHVEAGARP